MVIACALATGAIAAAGCGSSKPAYCSSRNDLENAVKGLTSLNVSSGVSGLEAQHRTSAPMNSLSIARSMCRLVPTAADN